MSKNVVWISPHLPYDTVGHAGGQTQNYYLKKLIESGKYDVRLISFYWDDEIKHFTLSKHIGCELIPYHSSGFGKKWRNLLDLNYQRNPFNKYANITSLYIKLKILERLRKIKREDFVPDVVVLQWTQIIVFIDEVKKVFPNVKVISIEEDVTFQSFERRLKMIANSGVKWINCVRYRNILEQETEALKKSDLIILNNLKDKKLLKDVGIEKYVKVWAPFYHDMSQLDRKEIDRNKIIYFGDMSRPENYRSAEWFIEKVMPLIQDLHLRFEIIGGKRPDKSLYKYECENIIIKGYVENIADEFSSCLCMVAPLVLGAGIKIKVLEAMSAGVPVLTNEIGIEGIPAKDSEEFLYCSSPVQYSDAIRRLTADKEKAEIISENAKAFMRDNFDYRNDSFCFEKWVENLANN